MSRAIRAMSSALPHLCVTMEIISGAIVPCPQPTAPQRRLQAQRDSVCMSAGFLLHPAGSPPRGRLKACVRVYCRARCMQFFRSAPARPGDAVAARFEAAERPFSTEDVGQKFSSPNTRPYSTDLAGDRGRREVADLRRRETFYPFFKDEGADLVLCSAISPTTTNTVGDRALESTFSSR